MNNAPEGPLHEVRLDGVRYVNKWEPLGSVNRVAYFVIDRSNLLPGQKQAGAYKI